VSPTLVDVFAADPREAVLRLLESAGTPLAAGEIKQALVSGGVPKADADRKWVAIQRSLKAEPHVVVEGSLYRWTVETPVASPNGEVVDPGAETAGGGRTTEKETAARLRQAELDGLRALSELAAEVEELVANEVDPAVLVRRVRARVKRAGLEPIDRAGEDTVFDRRKHAPIDGAISDGASVTVVRPGYVWSGDGVSLVIGKAVVEE
jgi:hypothetical protein